MNALSFVLLAPFAQERSAPGLEWNARNAEHLLNRAAFGAAPGEVERALAKTPAQVLDELLTKTPVAVEPFAYEVVHRPDPNAFKDPHAYFEACAERRRRERKVIAEYADWWVAKMVAGQDPLREKMVLFWHNHLVSSAVDVKSYVAMIRQNELFRREGLGSFRTLMHAIVRDPAMIVYLDNDQNVVGNPNENLAREIMELFALGIGNYTEQDIKEGARALTGWKTDDIATEAKFLPKLHDTEKKSILGRSGDFGADEFVDVLLDQPACPRFIAGKLLAYFEGTWPDEARHAEYAAYLKAQNYELAPFLRKLFLDPRFYRDEIRGQRIAGPVEYMVGCARRLAAPFPPQLLMLGAAQLGQRLFEPPNVKGWEGGEAWIRTSTLIGRGNMAGVLMGVVSPTEVIQEERFDGQSLMDDERVTAYRPKIDMRARVGSMAVGTDAALVDALADQLLPVPLTAESRAGLVAFLVAERQRLGVAEGKLLDAGEKTEDLLRRLAHLILSLPEAQLG
jgi:uncharacterized protein (DUF1800 family)